jgi:hypothetical protein
VKLPTTDAWRGGTLLLKEVDLDNTYASSLRFASHLGGVLAGLKGGDEGCLQIVSRLQTSSFEFRLLAAAIGTDLPIIILYHDGAVPVP